MKTRIASFGLGSLMSAALVMGAVTSRAGDGVQVLADFGAEDVAGGWQTVNDNVMGGRSKGNPTFADGVLIFSGETNTNGGGFSSIRTKPGAFDLSANSGLLMRVKGDGRTYKAELRTDVTMRDWAIPFRADFETEKGEWMEVYLALEAFVPTFFGRELTEAPELEPERVSSIGFMIYDKKDGPFRLEVDWVKAVTRGGDADGEGTVVDALAGGEFGTLAAALKAAGLLEALQAEGPFTVFAPTDEAFAKLPGGTVENLLKEENREQLRAVLAYHAIAGSVSAGDALNAGKAKTLNGAPVAFGIEDGVFKVNGATIRSADLAADNGVIHVIDAVLLPPSSGGKENGEKVAERRMAPVERIEAAIGRGVPLFNRGEAGECAVVYRECLTALSEDASVDPGLRQGVKRLLTQAKQAHDDVERAWIYRGGLDQLYVALARHSS